MTAVSVYNIYM